MLGKRKINAWFLLILTIVAVSILVALIMQEPPPAPYQEKSSVEISTASEPPTEEEMIDYQHEEPNFTLQLPADWVPVIQNGYPTWIHREFASSIQIQTEKSTPDLLKVTKESVQRDIESIGGELVQFYWADQWDYVIMYRTFQKFGTTAHIEVTAFNQMDVIRLVFTINEIHYEKLEKIISDVIDSFVWNRIADS